MKAILSIWLLADTMRRTEVTNKSEDLILQNLSDSKWELNSVATFNGLLYNEEPTFSSDKIWTANSDVHMCDFNNWSWENQNNSLNLKTNIRTNILFPSVEMFNSQ